MQLPQLPAAATSIRPTTHPLRCVVGVIEVVAAGVASWIERGGQTGQEVHGVTGEMHAKGGEVGGVPSPGKTAKRRLARAHEHRIEEHAGGLGGQANKPQNVQESHNHPSPPIFRSHRPRPALPRLLGLCGPRKHLVSGSKRPDPLLRQQTSTPFARRGSQLLPGPVRASRSSLLHDWMHARSSTRRQCSLQRLRPY